MSAKKPLVLDVTGELQQIQTGDFLDITNGGTGAITAAGAITALGAVDTATLTAATTTLQNEITAVTATANAAATAANLTTETTNRTAADALLVPKTTTVNGHALSANITVTAADVGLGSVNNTADSAKPVSTAQAAADAATLVSANAYADGLVVGLWDDRGSWNASGNAFPTTGGSGAAGAIVKGDIWTISTSATAGALNGIPVGSTIRATANTPGQTTANWAIAEVGLGYVPYNATNPAGYISGNQTVTVSGDAAGSGTTAIALTVSKVNGVALASLATGILKNTTTTGAPSIAVAADFPVLNQNTTGKAATAGIADSCIGNAATVTTNANLTGDVTSVGNAATLAASGVTAGTYQSVTVDVKGRVTAGTTLIASGTFLASAEAATVVAGSVVYSSAAGVFKKAIANAAVSAYALGMVSADVTTGATGAIITGDEINLTTAQWDALSGQTGGLTPGATYFASNSLAGGITSTVPSTGYVIALGHALSATKFFIRVGTKIQL